MRAILVALLLIVTASCGLVGRTGPACGRGLRRYYLTKTTVPGNQALTACAAGFHMASRFEILDVSVLDYDPHLGFTTDDSGAGPPSAAAKYGSTAPSGWMRTGGGSQYTDATRAPGIAFTNCATWASNSHDAYGTVGWLTDRFTAADGAAPWQGGSESCDLPQHVWCVENYPAREPELESGGRRHRGGGHGAEELEGQP